MFTYANNVSVNDFSRYQEEKKMKFEAFKSGLREIEQREAYVWESLDSQRRQEDLTRDHVDWFRIKSLRDFEDRSLYESFEKEKQNLWEAIYLDKSL
ncbi:MAG: hypothetical protein P8Z79_21355 [Sedimentisphaerales bacterium]|jgi:hypothetical protein